MKKSLNFTILYLLGPLITFIPREFSYINSISTQFGNTLGRDGEGDTGAQGSQHERG
ncbi:MAG: hypothetical protein P0116_10955 [Candidatus Nitrosocosmicus sp.]|nr:hypothetical protein [Candidatus Nitrosocosmicus sp.]